MAHTHPWSVTEPPGSALAADIDQKIRDLRLDLEERLEESVIVDMSADPVVAKPGIGGIPTRTINYSYPAGTGSAGAKGTDELCTEILVVKGNPVVPGGGWGFGVIELSLAELEIDLADVFAFKAQVWYEDETDSGIGFTLYVSSVWKVTSGKLAAQVRSGGGSSYSGPAAVGLLWTIWLV